MRGFRTAIVATVLVIGCRETPPGPAALDTKNDVCGFCRMAVSDVRFAGQIVAPGEEPRFFDDLGCLGHYVAGRRDLPKNAALFVADHRTGAWVAASTAVYTKVDALETPMGSHTVAHADAASREADPASRGGTLVRFEGLFPSAQLPGARP